MGLTYLTYLEPVSGVYEGQVIDVCKHIRDSLGISTQLIAVFSPRDFSRQRDILLARAPCSSAIRSPVGWRAWTLARRFIERQIAVTLEPGTDAILARGPIAAQFGLELKRRGRIARAGYDGRGAVSAEWSEYDVAPSPVWKSRIARIEREAVLNSDMRVAVSKKLVAHWREAFGYTDNRHVVIPSTLSIHHIAPPPAPDEIARRRAELGLSADQIVICYSGSAAEWQSIVKLDPWLRALLDRDKRLALLMMTHADLSATQVVKQYGDRVRQTWMRPDKVRATMAISDFGLLVREPTVTNSVAAPTKFAEYLAAGLRVLISPSIGDYSQMVRDHALGAVCSLTDALPGLSPTRPAERARLSKFAVEHFTKDLHSEDYIALLDGLGLSASRPTAKLNIEPELNLR